MKALRNVIAINSNDARLAATRSNLVALAPTRDLPLPWRDDLSTSALDRISRALPDQCAKFSSPSLRPEILSRLCTSKLAQCPERALRSRTWSP